MGSMQKILFSVMVGVFAAATCYGSEEIETNVFGYPLNEPIMVIDNTSAPASLKNLPKSSLPECNNPDLLNAVKQHIAPVVGQNNPNIIEKRKFDLLLKNITDFREINIDELSPQKYRPAAAKVIELKINDRITESEIKACRSQSPEIKDTIYVIVYNLQGQIWVSVISNNRKLPDFVFSDD